MTSLVVVVVVTCAVTSRVEDEGGPEKMGDTALKGPYLVLVIK
jgi:hypothetical protein